MASKDHHFKINPSPPTYLKKESLGVWLAWSRMGDREVIREAAAKGVHVELAYTFLTNRRQLDLPSTKNLFKDEVLKWMLELLSRRQIFRASHIITNINLEPIDEFTIAFMDTLDDSLRNYLGDHLVHLDKLDLQLKETWSLLKLMKENCVLVQNWNENLDKLNVKAICDKSDEWKCDVGTDLFFRTFDESLNSFVTSESAWKILLKQSKADLIKLWINLRYSPKFCSNNSQFTLHALELLTDLFSRLDIGDNLIELITDSSFNCSESFQNVVLDELSKYGIFYQSERRNFLKILTRLVQNGCVVRLREIFIQKTSNVSFNEFNEMLIDFCISNKHFALLNLCQIDFQSYQSLSHKYNSKHFNLMVFLNNSGKLYDKKSLTQNIIEVSKFVSDDLEKYIETHPLLLVMIILLSDCDLLALLKAKAPEVKLENLVITSPLITKAINNLPFLNAIVNPSTHDHLTYKDLLRSQNFKFDYRLSDQTVPNFKTPLLVEKFGYNKTVNYTFYLKQGRPSFAAKMYGSSNELRDFQSKVNRKVLKLIAQNFQNKEVTASCVAFLEMIGQNSECARIYAKAAEILTLSGNCDVKDIKYLITNVEKDPQDFLMILEKTLIKTCCLESGLTGANLVEELKKQELAVKFSRVHYLKLPQLFLEYCAAKNYWLIFLVFVQTFHYPLGDVQKLLLNFTDSKLYEHFLHGLSHEFQVDDSRLMMRGDRDARTMYLSRVGVIRQNVESPLSSIHSNRSSIGSFGSTSSSTGSTDFSEIENLEFTNDLLQILIKCHNSVDPPKSLLSACYAFKNPLFAVLAISYEPDSIITNWLTWLVISCDVENDYFTYNNMVVTSSAVADLLVSMVESGYIKTLFEGFQIFLPDNPLIHFVDFLANCIELNFDDSDCVQKLLLFETQVKQKGKNTPIIDTDYGLIFLFNQLWLESTATRLLAVVLQHGFISRYYQLSFLKLLVKNHIESFFTIEFPKLQNYVAILTHLLECSCTIKVDLSSIFNKETMNKELAVCIEKLLVEKHYNCSYKIAQILKAPADMIIVSQWMDKFENHFDGDFWTNCEEIFKAKNVQPAIAVNFFDNCSFKTTYQTERYKILKLAYVWAYLHNLPNVCEVERKMWLAFFQTQTVFEENSLYEIIPKRLLYSEIKQSLPVMESPISEEQIVHLDSTIEKLLNDDNLWQALRLASIFNHKNRDLEILILCSSLAEGILRPDQMSVEQRILLVGTGNVRTLSCRKRRTLMSSKGFSNFASTSVVLDQDVMQDILQCLETLVEQAKNGVDIAKNILMAYRISINTQRTYQGIYKCRDSLEFLNEVLIEDCINKLEVVHDVHLLFAWSQEQVADFLCEQLIQTIEEHIRLHLEPPMLWNLNLDNDFHVILQLLVENCSILGLKLYEYASTLHRNQTRFNPDVSLSDINLIIELLIRSHDCFTTDCNMEGISNILRKSRTIIALLLERSSWKLIVRLLTGVGRYTEMNYVFHILKENEQFEFLLCKGSRKDNYLKMALLNYLKKYCPDNRELYRMVALHFTLFSEIAELWEEESKSIIRNLIAISKLEMQNNGVNLENERYVLLTNTDGTKLCLNRAMINYTHATEYHLQGKKLNKALISANQAELLALQVSMLKGLNQNGTAICILNLKERQITSLISTELSFPQTSIVADAYNYKVDWSSVLFEQYVVRNQANYLDNFLSSNMTLSDTLVLECSRKFLNLKAISDTIIKNMKELVKGCTDVCMKYRIASELGFYDVVEELLNGSQLAYLKDTAWKTGFSH